MILGGGLSLKMFMILFLVLILIASCGSATNIVSTPNFKEQAFYRGVELVVDEMYAKIPKYYGCVETPKKPAASWQKINVDDLGNEKFEVIGYVKAMNDDCFLYYSYFSITVLRSSDNKWSKEGNVFFSNPCVKKNGPCDITTLLDYKDQPDMNWRPPGK